MTYTLGEAFTGYGGLGLAVAQILDIDLAWTAENDLAASKVLARRWPDVPNLGDITQIDWSQVEPVDILTIGFPCQDVSAAGRRAGLRPGTRSGLWSHAAYAIDQLRPQLVIIENVRGLTSADAHSDVESCPWCVGDGSTASGLRALGAVLGDLADLGYDARWISLRASDVGAPHGRFRIFIVAYPAGDSRRVVDGDDGTVADAGRVELQRRADGGGVGGTQGARTRKGLQRQRGRDAAGDDGATAADAGGETVGLGAGLRQGGSGRLRRRRPDDDHPPDAADSDGSSRRWDESRSLTSGSPEGVGSQAGGRTRRGGGPLAADSDDRAVDRQWPRQEPRQGGGAPADAEGDGWDEGRAEPARVVGRPDAAERCPTCADLVEHHDAGGFCAGYCGGNCADPDLGRPDGPWNSYEDDERPPDGLGRAAADADVAGLEGRSLRGDRRPDQRAPRAGGDPAPSDAESQRRTGTLGAQPDMVEDGPQPAHLGPRRDTAADTDSGGRDRLTELDPSATTGIESAHRRHADGRSDSPDRGEDAGQQWGPYEPAIRRWEWISGRAATPPTEPGRDGQPRLSPRFVEWMMGLPEGWVTDLVATGEISRNDSLRILGNGVVPQQAAEALRRLFATWTEAGTA